MSVKRLVRSEVMFCLRLQEPINLYDKQMFVGSLCDRLQLRGFRPLVVIFITVAMVILLRDFWAFWDNVYECVFCCSIYRTLDRLLPGNK